MIKRVVIWPSGFLIWNVGHDGSIWRGRRCTVYMERKMKMEFMGTKRDQHSLCGTAAVRQLLAGHRAVYTEFIKYGRPQ